MHFPYLFVAYLLVGVAWILMLHRRKPEASQAIRSELDIGRQAA